jgi:prepilin-type N-terminal cleavage/methylation domain-containing protein
MTNRKGFTLIEILVVIAIIAILASIVLVGLGPSEAAARDARRLSDLHDIQNSLELYYNACGNYPGGAPCGSNVTNATYGGSSVSTYYGGVAGASMAVVPNLGNLPQDPLKQQSYDYDPVGSGGNQNLATPVSYYLGATLENKNNAVFQLGYQYKTTVPPGTTVDFPSAGCAAPVYCVSL